MRGQSAGDQEAVHDGQRSDSVHVVIAVEDDVFLPRDGLGQSFRRGLHAGCGERIGDGGEARIEEIVRLGRIGYRAGGEQRGEEGRDAQFAREAFGNGGIDRIPRLPAR